MLDRNIERFLDLDRVIKLSADPPKVIDRKNVWFGRECDERRKET